MAGKIKVKWYKSWIGYSSRQRETVKGLGLKWVNQVVELDDTPANRGAVKKINHLVKIVEG